MEPVIMLTGHVVGDPELRFTTSGVPVANFTIAHTPRVFDKDRNEWRDGGEPLFLPCKVWRRPAENAAETLRKGMHVIVQGELRAHSWEAGDGAKRTSVECHVEVVGPCLQRATATVQRSQKPQQAAPGGPAASSPPRPAREATRDPWAAPKNGDPSF